MGLDLGFFDSDYLPLLLLALAFILCGVICLLCRRHTGYVCLVVLEVLLSCVISTLYGKPIGIIPGLLLLPHIALLVYTIVRWKRLSFGKITKLIIVALLALTLVLSAIASLTPAVIPPHEAEPLAGTRPSSIAPQTLETT